MGTASDLGTIGVARRQAEHGETVRANRRWWDADAPAYQAEHGDFLGDLEFMWCPEGLTESAAGLLGPVAGRRSWKSLRSGVVLPLAAHGRRSAGRRRPVGRDAGSGSGRGGANLA